MSTFVLSGVEQIDEEAELLATLAKDVAHIICNEFMTQMLNPRKPNRDECRFDAQANGRLDRRLLEEAIVRQVTLKKLNTRDVGKLVEAVNTAERSFSKDRCFDPLPESRLKAIGEVFIEFLAKNPS